MKSKKVTMLAAALVVAVVAFAAVGYATTVYKAETSNGNNTVDVTYVTLSQSGTAKYAEGSFIDEAYFNTVSEWDDISSAEVITYTVTGEAANKKTVATGVDAYLISNDNLVLTVKDTEGGNYKLTISTSANMGAATGAISYYFGVKTTAGAFTWSNAAGSWDGSKTTWTIDTVASATAGIPYTVVVAAIGSSTTAPADSGTIVFDFVAESI